MTSHYPRVKIAFFILLMLLSSFFIYHKAEAWSSNKTDGYTCSVSISNDEDIYHNERCYNTEAIANEFARYVIGSWTVSGAAEGQGYVTSCILDPTGAGTNCQSAEYYNDGGSGPHQIGSLDCLGTGCTYADLTVTALRTVQLFGSQTIWYGCNNPTADNYGGAAPCTYPPPPTFVNLNFNVNSTCGPVSDAAVNIDQDFGNGTNRPTDGNGYANFGVWKNTNIGWSVSKSGFNGQNGNVNSGPNGKTEDVNLGNPPGVGTVCTGATSLPNACGQTNPGGNGTFQCNGSCSGSTGTIPPVTIPGGNTYGTACPSSANACGQTQSNGTWQCDGSCSSTSPANPPNFGSVCNPANACGQTNSGTIQCNGICSVSAPANPPNYGNSCTGQTSPPNACGQTNPGGSGTYQCNGLCSGANGTTPPDSSCPAPTATISANPNPVSYGGASTISWSSTNSSSCSVSGIGAGLSGSGSTGALYSNQTYTVTCTGLNGSQVLNSVAVIVSAPSIDIRANNSNGPITLVWNSSANLSWTSTSAGSCNASGDWSGSKALNSSESTGNLTNPKTYNYNLSCSGNGSDSDSVQIIVNNPVPNDPSNVTVTAPDYCVSGPAATITWTYSDPSGSPQQSYQVQMDEQGSFQEPEYDSCVNQNTCAPGNGSNSNFTGQGVLLFNKTYKTRVRVWNSYNVASDWTVAGGNFNAPPYAYPQVNFYWTANGIQNNPSPSLNKPVAFTDQTVFNGNPNGRRWSWTFGDGGTSTTQNPSRTYSFEGSYYVTLMATDNANQACSRTKGPLIIQKPIPRWREVAPQ